MGPAGPRGVAGLPGPELVGPLPPGAEGPGLLAPLAPGPRGPPPPPPPPTVSPGPLYVPPPPEGGGGTCQPCGAPSEAANPDAAERTKNERAKRCRMGAILMIFTLQIAAEKK
jgi:hypothetical protein